MSKPQDINNFNGYFSFLNNDFPTWVLLDGLLYPSVTTAFQAARTQDPDLRNRILNAEDFEELANLANHIKNPPDWKTCRYRVMETLVRDKFKRNKQIREKLMATTDRKLINVYKRGGENQLFWGVVNETGQNFLGKILESVRQEIKRGIDLERWLTPFGVEKDPELFPYLAIRVEKGTEALTKLELNKKNTYTFGSLENANDFHLEHPSISRQHACIYFSTSIEAYLVDLNSTAGTTKNNQPVPPLQPTKLSLNDVIVFGTSTRRYVVVKLDMKQAMVNANKKLEEVTRQLKEIESIKKDGAQLSSEELRSKLGFKIQDCLIVENIPTNTSTRRLQQIFGEYARVREAIICIDTKTGKEVGVGIVRFKDPKELADQIIVKKIKFEIGGRNLSIRLADSVESNAVRDRYNIKTKEEGSEAKQQEERRRKSRSRSRSRDKKKKHRDY